MRFLAGVLSVLLAGCVVSSGTAVPGMALAQTSPANVAVLYQVPAKPHRIVGFVEVSHGAGVKQEDALQRFRDEAAKLGAQAVVVDALPRGGAFEMQVIGRGRAIRFD